MNVRDLILIVEDDKKIAGFLETILNANQYDSVIAANGAEAFSLMTSHCPELILLDIGLPDIDGFSFLRKIRTWSAVPVIIVSAHMHEREIIHGLDLGADDYIIKPFGTGELLARIRSALRKARTTASKSGSMTAVFHIGDLSIDYNKHQVTIGTEIIPLTKSEYRIVALLSRHAGKVVTYDHILVELWGPGAEGNNHILRVNMANIRRKIEESPTEPRYIFTEIGVGYRMADHHDMLPKPDDDAD